MQNKKYQANSIKHFQYTKQLLTEFVFCEKGKPGRLNPTQEIQLVVLLLSDFFVKDDEEFSKFPFFIMLFEPGKKARQSLLLKFILTAIAIQSPAVSITHAINLNISNLPDFSLRH